MNYNVPTDIAKLKANLRTLVAKELDDFQIATGLTPSSVSIRFVETTTVGMPTRQHVISGVDVRFDF